MYFHHYDGYGPFGWLFFVFWLLVVGGLAWLLVSVALGRLGRPRQAAMPGAPAATPLELLDLRYARGEIDRETYLQARADLGAPAASG